MRFDFDDIATWGPSLSAHVSAIIPPNTEAILQAQKPEYIEDAVEIFFSQVCPQKQQFIATVCSWIERQTVVAYHGARLDRADIADIKANGLRALSAEARRGHLRKKLSTHRSWNEEKLDTVLHRLGKGETWGRREGQVHATFSRAGLVNGFNHYLTHGSEFDQCAASLLLGEEGKPLLAQYGTPVLITLAITGETALRAANPYGLPTQDAPNPVRQVMGVWSYWLATPGFSPEKQKYDCGLIFYHDIPPEWILSIDLLP